jgi:hypothetical protein
MIVINSICFRLAEGKESFIRTFIQKKDEDWEMKKVSKMARVETSTAAYRAWRAF